jgi:hypothetical protein
MSRVKNIIVYAVLGTVLSSVLFATSASAAVMASVTPNSGPVGTQFTVTGTGCPDNDGDSAMTDGRVIFSRTQEGDDASTLNIGPIESDANGGFSVTGEVPERLAIPAGGETTALTPGQYFLIVSCADVADNEVVVPFTVTGGTSPSSSTTSSTTPAPTSSTSSSTTSSTVAPSDGGTADRLPQAKPATPQKAQPTFTG